MQEVLALVVELNLLMSILANTHSGTALLGIIKKGAKLPTASVDELIDKLQTEGLLFVEGGLVSLNEEQRLRIASKAIMIGGDTETISRMLEWKEFEGFAAFVLESDGFDVRRNVRFKGATRRFEVDLVALKKPNVLCIDCKHWARSLSTSALQQVVQKQVLRAGELIRSLPFPGLKVSLASWSRLNAIPVVLSLLQGRVRFCEGVPLVSILQFHDFLMQLPAYVDTLNHLSRDMLSEHLDRGLQF